MDILLIFFQLRWHHAAGAFVNEKGVILVSPEKKAVVVSQFQDAVLLQ